MTDTIERPAATAPDLELLRHFEPVLRFTKGETFYPMAVDDYLAAATHLRRSGGTDVVLGERGTLTPATLATDPTAGDGREFITVAGTTEDERLGDLLRMAGPQASGFRRGSGRLARVGYASRLIDALFSLALLARGRVPGSLARRSVEQYRALGNGTTHAYYGRVVRTETWIALQYWYFYSFNDWRSGFNGANDHEADWEQVIVYVYTGADGRVVPRWVAYAQHDYHGAELRRRWDHAGELELVGDHPVVQVGAGSHASYFVAGEYLAEQELKLPGPIRTAINTVGRVVNGPRSGADARIVPIAFVDFARGDGVSIGAGGEREWTPVVLDESQPWVSAYRGLWGVSVDDPFEGEDAPAGPMFNRDGSVRRSWSDPVAFAGLDIVPPPSRERDLLLGRIEAIDERAAELAATIPDLEQRLAAAGAEGAEREVGAVRAELTATYEERSESALRLAALRHRLAQLEAGRDDPPGAHLRRAAAPAPPGAARTGALLEAWAALSIGLLLLALVGVLLFAPTYGWAAAILVIAAFIFVESILQRRVIDMMVVATRIMALAIALILAVTFWQPLLIGVAIAAGVFVIRENVSELASGR